MKKFDFGQSLAIFANLSVIAGIAFLALELRQITQISQMDAADRYTAQMNELELIPLTYSTLSDALRNLPDEIQNGTAFAYTGSDLTSLSPEERRQSLESRELLAAHADDLELAEQYDRLRLRTWQAAYHIAKIDETFSASLTRELIAIVLEDQRLRARMDFYLEQGYLDPEFSEFLTKVSERSRTIVELDEQMEEILLEMRERTDRLVVERAQNFQRAQSESTLISGQFAPGDSDLLSEERENLRIDSERLAELRERQRQLRQGLAE